MDFNSTTMPAPTESIDIFDNDKTPTLSETSYEKFLKPIVTSNEVISKTFVADLSQNSLYRKRMERRRLEKKYLYSVQIGDNYVEYTTESPGNIQNWLSQKYQFFLDTSQMKELKEKGLIVIQLKDSYEIITITKTSK